MDRTACVDLPAFPLQLLLRREPTWRGQPVAVVADDRPGGTVLWVNERARRAGVLPGLRYAAGLALAAGLRAAVVPQSEIDAARAALGERLRRFTPHVEPSGDEPGLYWLDARGVVPLHGSLEAWAAGVGDGLTEAGFRAAVVVGFSRFGSYALARAYRGVHVLHGVEEERTAARAVRLDRLALPPAARDLLARLGIVDVGGLVDLPREGVAVRLGPEAERLVRQAAGDLALPLQPERPDVPVLRRLRFERAESDVGRLLAAVESLLGALLDEVGGRAHALVALEVGLRFERLGDHLESVRPAQPTLDPRLVLELVRLRLESLRRLPDAVVELVLVAGETAAAPRQSALFASRRRDLAAGNRALARVRARLGEEAVVRARLRDAHLPEARFAWEPGGALAPAQPRAQGQERLVRRIHVRALPLPPRERHEPDGWMLRGLEQGPVVRVLGPYVVSGGWWARPAHREYHFAETRAGELLWLYYDRARRRWFLQGRVE